MWKCDRDDTLFDDKKAAEEHDKMLELAANISCWLEKEITDISEETSEAIGMLIAKNKENMQKAMKGKPEILLLDDTQDLSDNVTPIAG